MTAILAELEDNFRESCRRDAADVHLTAGTLTLGPEGKLTLVLDDGTALSLAVPAAARLDGDRTDPLRDGGVYSLILRPLD